MCELFGITSKEKVCVNSYLKEFFSHSDKHPHGWGLASLDGIVASMSAENKLNFLLYDGELVMTGTNHQKEHFDNEENLKYIYQIFSNL